MEKNTITVHSITAGHVEDGNHKKQSMARLYDATNAVCIIYN
jgi:hypothetical protein